LAAGGVLWLLCSFLTLLPGCDSEYSPRSEHSSRSEYSSRTESHPYSLIWISLDTLRADHLGIYGYERETSPFLDDLARRGLYFNWAVTPQNTTLPAHITMFTGYHPTVHQVMFSRSVNPGVQLKPSVITLPVVLQEAGFATRAWVDGGKMSGHHGFNFGFEKYDDEPCYFPKKLSAVLDQLDELAPESLFFYFIHTYQLHSPYPAPVGYDDLYTTEGTKTEAQEKRDLYDGCIRFVDDQLSWFVEELEKRGIPDRTIIVITGDHGENFQEYGFTDIGHGSSNLHQNITRVPWIILHPDPAYRGRCIPELTGLVDFPNTMLALLGFDEILPGGGVNVFDPGQAEPREYLSWTLKSWSLFSGEYHLIYSEKNPSPENNRLYRFTKDVREEVPLDDPEVADILRERLKKIRAGFKKQSQKHTSNLRQFGPWSCPTR